MNILDSIIAAKKHEVNQRKQQADITSLKGGPFFTNETMSLKKVLAESRTGIIAEFKKQSPSKGIINADASVEEITKGYTKFGASGLSVLTDHDFFGGSLDDLLAATVNAIPILRKDFIIDEYQLYESKAFGAGVILLIAACLTRSEVKNLAKMAKDLGLEVLLEIHDVSELDHICDEVDIVGVNNRDLKTFNVNIERSIELGRSIPSDMIKISESGLSKVTDVKMLRRHGFRGFLMGGKFMSQKDPVTAFSVFMKELQDDEN